MSATNSNLSAAKYGYDLVVGTTQASINATMKQFLLKFHGQDFIRCYIYDPNVPSGQSHYVATDFAALKTRLGFDPFDVPTGTPASDPRMKSLLENKFAFAFKASMGLPTSFPLSAIPPVIELNKGNTMVTYNLFCRNFQILNLNPGGYEGPSWDNLSQEGGTAPWTFQFNVSLDLYNNDSAFSHLPKEVQDQVKNLCPGSMFSVQQLYLDLNTAGLESTPTIRNLDPTSNAYIYLTRIFLNAYFKNLQDNSKSPENPDGNYLLGYTIKPKTIGNTSSIVPTDLNFVVSPYINNEGKITTEYDLYTLDWLVMTDKNKMPAPVQFEWNWVDKADQTKYHGAMAIKKSTFANFLNKLLSPSLRSGCRVPSCKVDVGFASIGYSWNLVQETAQQSYQTVNDGTSKILTFNYTKKSSDSGVFVPNWGNMDLNYTLQTDVYLEGVNIRTVSTATCYVHMNADGGVAEGNAGKITSTMLYALGVDASGRLTVKAGTPERKDESDDVKPDIWGEIVSFGTFDNVTNAIKNNAKTWLNDFLAGHDQAILSMLNGSGLWVFPGGQTFVFKNAQFSEHQDLVANITYADPVATFSALRQAKATTVVKEAAEAVLG